MESVIWQADKADTWSQDSLFIKLDKGNVVCIIVSVILWMDLDLGDIDFLSCILFSFFAMSTYPRKQGISFNFKRIYNKILDRDWFSARLFVTQSARNHVGVRLQVFDLNFFKSDTCN